jgi:DNA recombination protein RmuC
MSDQNILIGLALVGLLSAVNLWLLLMLRKASDRSAEDTALLTRMEESLRATRQEMTQSVQSALGALGNQLAESQRSGLEAQSRSISQLNEQLLGHNRRTDTRLESMQETIEKRLTAIQADSNRQLDEMRAVVDEKLQKTLNDRLTQSFAQVSERLEQVYKGLGEMQTLATGVGDLKKILANVKTRGILGEIQLGAILEQLLSVEQYETNVNTNPNTGDRVEFAIKLPGDGEKPVWLPIDAKLPADLYANLVDAYDAGDSEAIAAAGRLLEQRIKAEAKTIKDKYVCPPYTTDFAIMFLPFEGLYAEVVRRGLVDFLQQEYRITIAGPTTMAALLNALQMGFRTLAIQKRSSEVWELLGAVSTQFDKFAEVLEKARGRLRMADNELDQLIGTRTRVIQRHLRNVSALPEEQASELFGQDVKLIGAGYDDE